jgi:uncharacterized membrane protein YkvA (DUF1232 family)
MLELSDKQKFTFTQNVEQITTKDEERVLKEIDSEIEKLQKILAKRPSAKMEALINDAVLFHNILKAKDFPLSESSRKWIVFGLNYLIADFDLIPDYIPYIGYYDDALILSWIKNVVDYDITRFKFFSKAISIGKEGSILETLAEGNEQEEIIIIPGLMANKQSDDYFKRWIKLVQKSRLGANNPGISMLVWRSAYTPVFESTILTVDHELKLKPNYDLEKFDIEWNQLKLDYTHLAPAFYRDLKKKKQEHPDKKISVITLNAGTFVVDNPPQLSDLEMIDKYYVFGGCSRSSTLNEVLNRHIRKIYNFYNPADAALRFVFENFENNNMPIGYRESLETSGNSIHNVNAKGLIKRHNEYRNKFPELIEKI